MPEVTRLTSGTRKYNPAAEVTNKSIVSIEVERDGVGLKGNNLQRIVSYRNTWGKA